MEVTLPLYTEATQTSNTEAIHAQANYVEATHVETTDIKASHTEAACVEILKDTASNEISDIEHIKQLQKALKKTMRECSQLKRKLRRKGTNFEKIFTKDQRNFIKNRTQKEASWSDETVHKALKLYVACGEKGYEELLQQNLPFPSVPTLKHRIQGLEFKPGILEDVDNILKMKVSTCHE